MTTFEEKKAYYIEVSIHTPTKGVTLISTAKMDDAEGFNPHTHEGCDMRSELYCQLYKVSIHTPTKGVTKI